MGAIRWTDHDGCGRCARADRPPALVIRYIDYCLRKRRWWDYSWRRYGASSLRRRPDERDRAQRLEHVASEREPTERPVREDSSQDGLEQRHLVVAVFHVGQPAVI